jgi:hypothetical protein
MTINPNQPSKVRATFHISPALLQELRGASEELGTPLSTLVTAAVRRHLIELRRYSDHPGVSFPPVSRLKGGRPRKH